MGLVSDKLLEVSEVVIEHFHLSEDCLDDVEDIIMNNELPLNNNDKVIQFFQQHVVCPHCLSFSGPHCSCSKLERL